MRKEKTRKIEGIGTIVNVGSSCVGCMSWETGYIIIAINGERFRYQSDRIYELDLQKNDMVQVALRVKDNGNVFRFNLIEKLNI